MKYFIKHTIDEVLEYNKGFGILRIETLDMFRENAETGIQNRHLERLKKTKSLGQRTASSKIRWAELEELAVEFRELSDSYY